MGVVTYVLLFCLGLATGAIVTKAFLFMTDTTPDKAEMNVVEDFGDLTSTSSKVYNVFDDYDKNKDIMSGTWKSHNKSADADEYMIKLGFPAFIMKLMKDVEVTLSIEQSSNQTILTTSNKWLPKPLIFEFPHNKVVQYDTPFTKDLKTKLMVPDENVIELQTVRDKEGFGTEHTFYHVISQNEEDFLKIDRNINITGSEMSVHWFYKRETQLSENS